MFNNETYLLESKCFGLAQSVSFFDFRVLAFGFVDFFSAKSEEALSVHIKTKVPFSSMWRFLKF